VLKSKKTLRRQMMKEIQDRLLAMADEKYRQFQSGLMPETDMEMIIGVRTPALRKYAAELAKEPEALEFMGELPHHYYEENNLHAFLIEKVGGSFDEAVSLTETFLPYVDNWATCDSFAPKVFRKNLPALSELTDKWMASEQTFTVRYGIVTQMRYFLDEGNFDEKTMRSIASIKSEEYYINMAIAWYMATALAKQYDSAVKLIESGIMDKWVHNKSIQKARESYRVPDERKAFLNTLKKK